MFLIKVPATLRDRARDREHPLLVTFKSLLPLLIVPMVQQHLLAETKIDRLNKENRERRPTYGNHLLNLNTLAFITG